MLIKILYFVFLVVLFRFLFRLVRAVLTWTQSSRPQPPRDQSPPPRGKIIDVDFTETTSTGRKRER
jgi:hypothetical protein